ncbi:MAG: TrkA family potassium uptake protein [Acidobacteria bacterium]|nr:MAG: TrkA family potassium uptake protein [Acidobacteriota bacterium]RLE21581.1 MAG: TrkA family potassium uptake protein [Acidobacteriota bacterium]
MKSICIIGLGQFGSHLAEYLSRNGVQVVAVDLHQDRVNAISDKVTQAFVGDVRDREVLETIIPKNVDAAVVSIGESIEPSILCVLHLSQIGIRKIIVKAVNDDHAEILRAIGAHEIVFPERDMAERTGRNLINKNMADILSLSADYSIKDIEPLPEFIGKNLIELDLRKKHHIYVIALKNRDNPDEITILPYIDTVIEPHHIMTVVGMDEHINALVERSST